MLVGLQTSLNAVIPMFVLIGLGYFCRFKKMIADSELKRFNNIAFHFFLPCQLFKNVYEAELKETFDLKLILYTLICVGTVYLFATIWVRKIEKSSPRQGVMIQSIFRSNFVLLGLPLAQAVVQDNLGPIPLLIGIVVPTFNALAVVTLEYYGGGVKTKFWHIIGDIFKNPLIVGSVSGLVLRLANINVYNSHIIKSSLTYLSQGATPIMLFILGASFQFNSLVKNKQAILACTVARLIVVPIIIIPIGIALGFRNAALVALLGIFATPPAANSYSMALQMGGDAELAGNLVVIGTAASCLTLFLWIAILTQLHFL